MKIEIYINDIPIESYTLEELQKIKETLTDRAFAAAGFVPEEKEM